MQPELKIKEKEYGRVESEIISSLLITFWCPSKAHCKWLQSLRMKFKVKTSQLTNRHKISPSAHYCATVPKASLSLKAK